MNTPPLESQHEPEAGTHRQVTDPEKREDVSRDPDSQAAIEAEVQLLFQWMKQRSTDHWFLGSIRETWSARPMTKRDADHLMQMPLQEVVTLLEEEKQKHAQRKRWRGGMALGLVALILLNMNFLHTTWTPFVLWFWLVCLVATVLVSDTRRAAYLALARFDDVQTVGLLAEALGIRYIGTVAAQALITLLPRLQTTDVALLNPAQRACLNKALRGQNTVLTLAILKAYERVGDVDAISEVQKLANVHGLRMRWVARKMFSSSGPAAREYNDIPKAEIPKVAAAAAACLPYLRKSAEQRQIDSELLRPSDANQTSSELLLRPAASHTAAEPPDQLLRPGDDAR